MRHFSYRNGYLFCEEMSVRKVAEKVGTPFYLYSESALLDNYMEFERAVKKMDHLVCYAFKANSNPSICRVLVNAGCGADVASAGELRLALALGLTPKKIVFNGNGKTKEEIELAIKADILMINVDSFGELNLINEVAGSLRKKARVALRINPEVEAHIHPYVATGAKKSKFGFELAKAIEGYKLAKSLKNIEVKGIHMHIGSQITRIAPFVKGLKKLLKLAESLQKIGVSLEYVNVGGGLGISYRNERPPTPEHYARAVVPLMRKIAPKAIFEPGRVLVGNIGILVTKVTYIKEMFPKKFIVVDAGMSDLIRPTLYNAYHEVKPVILATRQHKWVLENPSSWPPSTRKVIMDVVGPICESGDFLARDRALPIVSVGDLLAVFCVGAYGFSMSSNYNFRCRPCEVLVKGDRYRVIRQRETYEDLVRKTELVRKTVFDS